MKKHNIAEKCKQLKNRISRRRSQKGSEQTKTIVLQPTVLVLATYVLMLAAKLIDLTLINRDNEYFSVVILQMMIFLLPAALWCRFSGERYTKKLRLKLPAPNTIPFMLAGTVTLITGGLLISVLFGGLDSLSHNFSLYDTFISKDNGTVTTKLYLILAFAALPAVCEEFVYRGILSAEYERGGILRSIVFSSLFFALLHFNIINIPVYLFSGVMLSLMLYGTRSLFGVMIVHFLYNIFGLFGQQYMSALYNITGSPAFFVFLTAALFFASAAIFCGQAAKLYRQYLYRGESASYRLPVLTDKKEIKNSYTEVIRTPSAIACAVVYIIAIVISWL